MEAIIEAAVTVRLDLLVLVLATIVVPLAILWRSQTKRR